MRAWCLIAALLVLEGCAYKVQLTSAPTGADVRLPRSEAPVRTPAEVTLRWMPFRKQIITVSAAGYRTVSFDLRRSEIRASRYVRDTVFRPVVFTGQARGRVSIVLVPAHGPTGTWRDDEVP